MMNKTRLFIGALGGSLLIVGITTVLPQQTRPQLAIPAINDKYDVECTGFEKVGRCADKPFDHSYCQYPTRTTNPVDGCDNSDPCDSASAAKGGSGDCTSMSTTEVPMSPHTSTEPEMWGK